MQSIVFQVILSWGMNLYLSSNGFVPFIWKHLIWMSSLMMFSLKGPMIMAIKGFSSLSNIIYCIWWLWMSMFDGLTSKVGCEWYQPIIAWFLSSAAFHWLRLDSGSISTSHHLSIPSSSIESTGNVSWMKTTKFS